MLNRLVIERFKSIRSSRLEFGRINIFIGGNGSGKSNILEAIGVISAALDRGVSDGDLSRNGVRITPPELMKSAFKSYELPKTLHVSATMDKHVQYSVHLTGRQDDPLLAFHAESCTLGATKMFGRSHRGATALGKTLPSRLRRHRSMWDQIRTAHEFPEAVENALSTMSEYAIFSPQTDFLRGMQLGEVNEPPVGLHGEGLPEAVRGLLHQLRVSRVRARTNRDNDELQSAYDLRRQAFDLVFLPQWARTVRVGKIADFLTSRSVLHRGEDMVYFIDRYMHMKRNTLSVYDSSEGTLFLLFAAVLLAHSTAQEIFALDNVDSALNPRITRSLLESIIAITKTSSKLELKFGPRQVFLTSHNPTSLDAFDLFDKDQRVFVVERDDYGHTRVTRLKPRDGMTKSDWYEAKKGRSLSQLWLDGEIRGALGLEV